MELAGSVFDAFLLLPVSVAAGHWGVAGYLPLSARLDKLGENGAYWTASQCCCIKDYETVYDFFL